jgi:23S rRNA (cytosine1962-C5)-methyltransferase
MSLIVFEDEHLLAVNKPAGWNTHTPAPFAGEGIYDWLKHREPRWAALAIIHRLDKETSGVLVFGKTPEANRSLTQQFESRSVRKEYQLITDREVRRDQFTVSSSIVRAGEKYISRPAHAGTAHAETNFSVIKRCDGLTILKAEPLTGRTHQIRVHAAERGLPILGDTLYGGTPAPRVFLHARAISFKHPTTNQLCTMEALLEWPHKALSDVGGRSVTFISSPVVEPHQTTAWRLLHGASDGWPGFYIDQLGNFLLAQSESELSASQHALIEQLVRERPRSGAYHKRLRKHVRGAAGAEVSPQLLFGQAAPERFTVLENGLSFELSFAEGYSVGLFLDQRENRRRLLVNHVAADFTLFPNGAQSAEVLNVFAYTCAFSVAAARAGARTTSLDLSRKYLEWGQRNFVLNRVDPAAHDFIYGDAFDWLRRLAKKGRSYDCVILDPPTFSQSKESGTWQAERHYGGLVEAALPLLKPSGVLFASTNAARLDPAGFLETLRDSVTRSGREIVQQHYVPQPPDFPISRAEPAYLKTVWMRIQ